VGHEEKLNRLKRRVQLVQSYRHGGVLGFMIRSWESFELLQVESAMLDGAGPYRICGKSLALEKNILATRRSQNLLSEMLRGGQKNAPLYRRVGG